MPTLASQLISAERTAGAPGDTEARAAFRVCEKLRTPLSTLAGAAGYCSLLRRAWVLAKPEAPWLEGLQIDPEGSVRFSATKEAQLASEEAAQAARALIDELLKLLVTFIGEALTLRLVQDVWPQAAGNEANPGETPYEKTS